MKKISLIFAFLLINALAFSQTDTTKTGTIYFFRQTGFSGFASPAVLFVDSKPICKIKNGDYTEYQVPVGVVICTLKLGLAPVRQGYEFVKLNVEAGKKYYIEVMMKNGVLGNTVYLEEITENTFNKKLNKLEKVKDCKIE